MSDSYLTSKGELLAQTFESSLKNARTDFFHSGTKGSAVEEGFRYFLRRYVPRALEVCHGEIIDSHGRRSGQTDVIIVNDEHPLTSIESGPSLCFIEGVEATGEVKSVLTSNGLKDALKNSQKIKSLTPWKKKGATYNGNLSDLGRFENRKPFFVFALESQITIQKVAEIVKEYVAENELQDVDVLDAVFLLDKKESLTDYGDGKCTIQFLGSDGEAAIGMIPADADNVVADLLNWLYGSMLRMKGIDDFMHYYTSISHK